MQLDWDVMDAKARRWADEFMQESKHLNASEAAKTIWHTFALNKALIGQLFRHANELEKRIAELEGGAGKNDTKERARAIAAGRFSQ